MGFFTNRILGIDSRKKERMPICVLVEEPGTDQEFLDKSVDLSEDGIFIETERPHPRGSEITLRFALPGSPVVTVHGTVARVSPGRLLRNGRSDRQAGMAVRFSRVDEGSRTVIRRFVSLDPDQP